MNTASAPPQGVSPLNFGHDALLTRVNKSLRQNLSQAQGLPGEAPPLVVGLFGEWGSGKSYLLEAVGQAVSQWEKRAAEHTVVVPFNAWRYEREEHLLIPLLKVAQQALLKSLDASVSKDIRQREKLSDRVLLLGDLATSVYAHGGKEALQMLWRWHTGAVGSLVVSALEPVAKQGKQAAGAEGKKADQASEAAWLRWQRKQKALDEARQLKTPVDALHSLYFDFQEHLKAVTGRNPKALKLHRERLTYGGLGWWPRTRYGATQLWRWLQRRVQDALLPATDAEKAEVTLKVNLIFLVDDLDRCLPDKAVEVLEAIKLFMEVPGCVFVLALDEEVVERGIAHRYRDYALQGKAGLTPITGAEYLEKLVHLPVRLPRPSPEQAQWHLLGLNKGLFRAANGQPNELAQLVAALTPAVPRKYQRMATMLELAQGLMRDQRLGWRGGQQRWLVLVCALQLFAPALFRHLRVAGAGLLVEVAQWHPRELMDAPWQSARLQRRLRHCESAEQARKLRATLRLAELVAEALNNRSGFDVLGVLAEVKALQANPTTQLNDAQLTQLLALSQQLGEDVAAGLAPTQHERPEFANLADEEALFEAFSNGDLAQLRTVLAQEQSALQGRLLPDGLVMWWLERENTLAWWRSQPPAPQAAELWAALGPYLSQWVVLRLAADLGVGVLQHAQGIAWAQTCTATPAGEAIHLALKHEDAAHTLALRIPREPPKPASPWARCPGVFGAVRAPEEPVGNVGLLLDGFGRCFDLRVGAVVQRFRWIEPGSFLMGSPQTEPERADDEGPQHSVVLTQGFWLADTACTQAFWLAVVGGENPSDFMGDAELPVEQVNWSRVMDEFMPHLQALLPEGLEATLPTEAQWEYACRAGTSTPFSFGKQINPQQVNYAGNYPYNKGAKGVYREKTVPVKALPANTWGLFQMHGNVWEWCFDAPRTYAEGTTVDPLGAVGDGPRALRGGSWINDARNARSAFRYRGRRDFRYGRIGFRVALRFKPSQGR